MANISENINITELITKNEKLDNNVSMEDGAHDLMEEEILNNSIKSVKQEPTYEKTQHLYAINYENIKLEGESRTEVIKSETFDDEITMEVGRIKNETPEEGSNDINSVISEKHEPLHENNNQLCTINYEQIKLEKNLHTEIIIKDEIMDESDLKPQDHKKKKPYLCDLCNKSFNRPSELVRHKRVHSGERPFSCNICNKAFTQKGALNLHKLIHSGEKPFSCNICSKRFYRPIDLVRHKRIHGDEKPFSCKICNEAFAQKGTLDQHKRIHREEKAHSCEICSKRFYRPSELVRHKRVHSGEKPFPCNICNKAFTQKGALNLHKLIHSGEKLFSCDICNKMFTQKSSLVRHKRVYCGENLL